MPRPRTPLGTYGRIQIAETAPGVWRARTRFRFDDGSLRQVERFASTETKATNALKRAMTTIAASSSSTIRRETTLSDLADRFLLAKADKAPRTVDSYRQTIEHLVKPNVGRLAIAEATTERLQRFVSAVQATNGPSAAKACRAVLSGMMGLAARSNAIAVNPVRELDAIPQRRQGATAIPVAQLPILLERVRADERLRATDHVDLLEFLAATGCRIGEACGLSWDDVDLDAGTVTIRATAVRSRGSGLSVQDRPKTRSSARTITVPASLVELLRRRLAADETGSMVFPTLLGQVRDPRAVSREWRDARERLGFPGVTTHSFRKTVATVLDQAGLSARDIAEYLGHENPSITQDVYMAKNTGGARAASVLDRIVGTK